MWWSKGAAAARSASPRSRWSRRWVWWSGGSSAGTAAGWWRCTCSERDSVGVRLTFYSTWEWFFWIKSSKTWPKKTQVVNESENLTWVSRLMPSTLSGWERERESRWAEREKLCGIELQITAVVPTQKRRKLSVFWVRRRRSHACLPEKRPRTDQPRDAL